MKLKKLIKCCYHDFLDYGADHCETTRDMYSAAFHDGILHTVMAMRELGLNIMVIKKVVDEIDPNGESVIYDLISEEFDDYLNRVRLD